VAPGQMLPDLLHYRRRRRWTLRSAGSSAT
jgi:hypothetical protein